MVSRLHLGARSLRGAISAYAKAFQLLEVEVPSSEGKAPAGPSAATLRKWRRDVGPTFQFAVVAGPAVAALKPSPAFERELEATLALVNTLQARAIVLRTPPDVSPAPVWRTRLAALLERLPRDVGFVAWEPRGVWDVDQAARQAKSLGMVLVVDAARDDVPPGPVAYVRLRALGETRSFGPAALARVAARLGDRKDAFVVIETDGALKEAKNLRKALAAAAEGGREAPRVLRPRGGIRVPDDEQE